MFQHEERDISDNEDENENEDESDEEIVKFCPIIDNQEHYTLTDMVMGYHITSSRLTKRTRREMRG